MVSGNFTSCHGIFFDDSTQCRESTTWTSTHLRTHIHGVSINFVNVDPEPFGLFSTDRLIAGVF